MHLSSKEAADGRPHDGTCGKEDAADVDLEDYLRRMLERIADHPISQVVDLLLWNMVGLEARLDQRIVA